VERDASSGGASLLGPGSHSREGKDGTAPCPSGRQQQFEQCRRILFRRCTGDGINACSMRERITDLSQEGDEKYRTVRDLTDTCLKQDSQVKFMLEKLEEVCPLSMPQ
jgi:hypothetical protein